MLRLNVTVAHHLAVTAARGVIVTVTVTVTVTANVLMTATVVVTVTIATVRHLVPALIHVADTSNTATVLATASVTAAATTGHAPRIAIKGAAQRLPCLLTPELRLRQQMLLPSCMRLSYAFVLSMSFKVLNSQLPLLSAVHALQPDNLLNSASSLRVKYLRMHLMCLLQPLPCILMRIILCLFQTRALTPLHAHLLR